MLAEEPHLEFVRSLRARGMADLALQYLESQSQKPPPALAVVLPLELAKTRLELAAAEPDATRRANLQNQARLEFEAFLKNNPKHPLAADARLEIARIIALQGKADLSRARRQDTKEAEQAERKKAREKFEEAAKQLEAAKKQIDAQLAGPTAPKTPADPKKPPGQSPPLEKEALSEASLQAEFEVGLNLLNQAQTYTEQNEIPTRGKIIKAAIEGLGKVANREPKTATSWLASVWLGRCHQENDDPKTARGIYGKVMADPSDQAEAARRLAGYFRILAIGMDRQNKDRMTQVQKAAEEWLRTYPHALNSPEGYGVRFELASSLLEQATALPKGQQQTPKGQDLFERAQKLFQALEQTDNDFAKSARENRLNIILTQSLERNKGDITKLKDFDACFYRAQYEIALLHDAAKKLTGEKLEVQRKQHFKNLLDSLNRALDLAQAKDREEEVNEARYLLAYSYLATDDYYRAAAAGEDLARTALASPRAPAAGVYALRAYALLIGKQEQAGVTKEELEPDRARVRRLAQYIEETWPTDPAADAARHVLGLIYLTDKKTLEAIDILSRISPAYPDATRSLYQLAGAALQAEKDGAKPPPGQQSFHDRAVAALTRIPELTPGADAGTVHDYINAKLILGDVYYRAKQFDQLEALASAVLKGLDGLDDKTRTEHRPMVMNLMLYAKLGRAEAEYDAGHYEKSRQALEPFITQLKDPAKAGPLHEAKEKDPQVVRALLGLALCANVQDNRVIRGKEILDLLQKAFPDNYLDVLVQSLQRLRLRVEQLRDKGPSAKPDLEKTTAHLKTFLNDMVKEQEKKAKPDILLFLAQSYSTLEDHKQAAKLASLVPQPQPREGKAEPDPQQLQLYQVSRVLYGRELRLSKQYKEAETVLKGIQNLEAKKEEIYLLQDQEKYALAGGEWNSLMTAMQSKMYDNKVREQYFDGYYNLTYCLYKNAFQLKDPKKKADKIRAAANFIVKLEEKEDTAADAAKKRLQELLEKEPPLKEWYDKLKRKAN
jgi:hypothetical protein